MRVPFGAAFAMKLGQLYPSTTDYINEIDRLLVFMGRYGRQSIVEIQSSITTKELARWCKLTGEFLDKENAKPGT